MATPAAAQARSTASACAGAPEDGFTDTGTEGSEVESAVDCLKAYAIAAGKTATLFAPNDPVNRGQLALFVFRKLQKVTPALTLNSGGTQKFPDVPPSSVYYPAVQALANANIIGGYGDGLFRPTRAVTREESTKFIANEMTFAGVQLQANAPNAFDDDNGRNFETFTNQLAALGIVQGTATRTFSPTSTLTRGQMAIIIARNLAELVDRGKIPPLGQGALNITPTDATFRAVSTSATDNTGAREYTVSGVTGPIAICLFPSNTVATAGNPPVLRDTNDDNIADGRGTTQTNAAVIELVNSNTPAAGGNPPNSPQCQFGVQPVNGTVTFRIDSQAADVALPIVWRDTNTDGQINLDSNNRPIEPVGVGGQTTWAPPEAASGAINGVVAATAKDFDTFVALQANCQPAAANPNVCAFQYDSNDVFQVGGAPVTLAQFEARISTGDGITGTYAADNTLVSTFNLADNQPVAPGGVAANASGTTNRITVMWNDADATVGLVNVEVDSYNVYRTTGTTGQNCPTALTSYTLLTNVTDNEQAQQQHVDNTVLFNTTYCYVVTSVDEGDESAASAPAQATTIAQPGDVTGPQSTDLRLTASGAPPSLAGTLDAGDTFEVLFDEVIAAPAANATIRVRDTDGTSGDIQCGTNATCTRQSTFAPTGATATNRVLRVVMTGPVANISQAQGANNVLQIPADVVDSGGITDAANNEWNVAASPDKTIDNN